MWGKIKGYLFAFFLGIATIGGVLSAIFAGRKKGIVEPDRGSGQREQAIDDSITRHGQEIDRSLERVKEIGNIIGSPEGRQSGIDEAMERRKKLHDRVTKILDE